MSKGIHKLRVITKEQYSVRLMATEATDGDQANLDERLTDFTRRSTVEENQQQTQGRNGNIVYCCGMIMTPVALTCCHERGFICQCTAIYPAEHAYGTQHASTPCLCLFRPVHVCAYIVYHRVIRLCRDCEGTHNQQEF